MRQWRILSVFVFTPLFLLDSIALSVTNAFAACLFDFCVDRINPGTFSVALSFHCSGHSQSSKPLPCSISDSPSAAQSSLLSFGLSKSPFQFRQFLVSEMLPGVLSSSLSNGWWLILRIWWRINSWVCPPGRSFPDNASGEGDHSACLNAATPSYWKCDQDALTISSVSKMYPTAVICLFWGRDSFVVARRFWMPCHMSKKSWTLAILCKVRPSASFFISELLSVSVVSNAGSSPAKIPFVAWANCLTTTYSWRVSPVVFDCVQRITSCPREKLDSTPTQCGMIEKMSHTILGRLGYFECISSCWRHQLVMSGIQNVLLISIGSEWWSLRFESICPQIFVASGSELENSLAAVNKRAAGSLFPGVDLVTLLGIKYCSSALDESYESKDDWAGS